MNKCTACDKAKMKFSWLLVIALYTLIVFAYGQIELIKKLISLF